MSYRPLTADGSNKEKQTSRYKRHDFPVRRHIARVTWSHDQRNHMIRGALQTANRLQAIYRDSPHNELNHGP